ncbi:MAG: glycosyltransferase family 4 protein, partial [Acidimicrobiales bacterium]
VPAHRELDPAVFTVLFVGRLAPEKGLPVLIDALGSLQRSIAPRQVRFLVVGTGPLQADIAKQCADLGIQCEFAGAVSGDAVLGYYHRADVLCMASFREGIPITLMEAMACELPCVAPHITAIPELIEHDVTGLTTTAGRSDLIAEQLLRCAKDPEFGRDIGRAGRTRVVAEFNAQQSVEQMSDFFGPILDRARSELA